MGTGKTHVSDGIRSICKDVLLWKPWLVQNSWYQGEEWGRRLGAGKDRITTVLDAMLKSMHVIDFLKQWIDFPHLRFRRSVWKHCWDGIAVLGRRDWRQCIALGRYPPPPAPTRTYPNGLNKTKMNSCRKGLQVDDSELRWWLHGVGRSWLLWVFSLPSFEHFSSSNLVAWALATSRKQKGGRGEAEGHRGLCCL